MSQVTLSKEKTELFLKYVTGYEIMASNLKIIILFKGISENEQMLPKANTCSSLIIISRFFLLWFSWQFFENLLSNENVWEKSDNIQLQFSLSEVCLYLSIIILYRP